MKEKEYVYKLAFLYFEGKISRNDEAKLFEYIKQSQSHHADFCKWEKEWLTMGHLASATNHAWSVLERRMHMQEIVTPMLIVPKQYNWRRVAAIALILILTAGGAIGLRQLAYSLQPEEYFVYETPYGEKGKIVLSDGTKVWLNAGSTLKYSNSFNSSHRKVELTGEGYFEVSKCQGADFIVQTRGYDVVVKGTKFDICAYADDSFVTTTLFEGKVELDCENRKMLMSPGESLRFNLGTGQFSQSNVNAIQSKAWIESRIEFEEITLKELVTKLSRQYDVNITLESGNVGDIKFRISLRNKETIKEVIDALAEIIPITVTYKGKNISINDKSFLQ